MTKPFTPREPNLPTVGFKRYYVHDAYRRRCPTCGQSAGVICTTKSGNGTNTPHVSRDVA